MHQFFVKPEQIADMVAITGSDVNHIRNVLRMKPGEEINVSNGIDGKEYRCGILALESDRIVCEIRFIKEASHELPSRVYLFQGLPKADKMESIIQKNIELGVFSIIPVQMKRCVVKLDEKKAAQKTARWQDIAESAAKQSRRGVIPQIMTPMSFQNAVSYALEHTTVRLLPYELAKDMAMTRQLFQALKPGDDIALFIGPEGGFDPEEVQLLTSSGFQTITLGKRILRTETAGMCVMSIFMYLLEEDL